MVPGSEEKGFLILSKENSFPLSVMDLGVSLEVGAVKPKSEEGRVSKNNPTSKNENWKFRGLDCAIKLTPQLFAFCCPRVNGVFFDSP